MYFQGAITGLLQVQMDERFDEIAAFADIGEFIDQPVRTYSSGMFLRLAFAVAVHVDPEVLVVDEALAVGDAFFQKRCYARIRKMQQSGLTVILVSHDHELVRTLTSRALLLGAGTVLFWGSTREATHQYRKILFESEALRLAHAEPSASQPLAPGSTDRKGEYGIGGARIVSLGILGNDGKPCSTFRHGDKINFDITVLLEAPLNQLNIAIVIKTLQGLKIYSWGTLNQDIATWAGLQKNEIFWQKSFQSGDKITVTLTLECNIGVGSYDVQAVVSRELDRHYGSQQVLHWRDEIGSFRVEMNSQGYSFGGLCDMQGKATFHG